MSWWDENDEALRKFVLMWLAVLAVAAAIREGRTLMRGTPIGWILLGAALGALGTVAWHIACEPCQARAKAWRRKIGSRLIE